MTRTLLAALVILPLTFGCATMEPESKPEPAAADKQKLPQTEAEAARQARQRGELYVPRAFEREIVSIECDDGYHLAADFLRRKGVQHRMPGIVLIHGAGEDRKVWYPLTIQMAARGFAVLALDLRGHGENPATKGKEEDFLAMPQDIRNAISHLAIKQGVDGGRLALIGSSLGANLALITAAASWADAVRCVIAISPGLDYHGLAPMEAASAIPKGKAVLLAAGKADEPSYAAAQELMSLLAGPKELYAPDSDAHGLKLFRSALFTRIPGWFMRYLPPTARGPRGGARTAR